MSYQKVPSKYISAKASASMLLNNLAVTLNAVTNGADLLFVHKSVVHLLMLEQDSHDDHYSQKQLVCKIPSANQQMSFVMVLQADWVETAGRKLLVMATQKGIKIYAGDGSALLYWHGFGGNGESVVFTRGICSVGSNTICVGTSSGQLLVFSIPSKGDNITFEEYLSGHSNSITTVVSRGDNLVSAAENGDIVIWKHMDGSSFKQLTKLKGKGYPCNCLDLWKNLIVAGYASGHLRIFDVNSGDMLAEITAHGRSINAVHIAQGSGLCLSASDDTFVRVWKLRTDDSLDVSQLYCDSITDRQLVGAQFIDNDGKSFAVTAYDSSEILIYQKA